MSAIRDHFSSHPSHMAGCGIAVMLVIVAVVFSLPVLAILGAAICGAMMLAMVWMMFSMVSKTHR